MIGCKTDLFQHLHVKRPNYEDRKLLIYIELKVEENGQYFDSVRKLMPILAIWDLDRVLD